MMGSQRRFEAGLYCGEDGDGSFRFNPRAVLSARWGFAWAFFRLGFPLTALVYLVGGLVDLLGALLFFVLRGSLNWVTDSVCEHLPEDIGERLDALWKADAQGADTG